MANGPTRHRIKIERAKEHIRNLEKEITGFREGGPYRAVFNQNARDGWADYIVRTTTPIPLVWGAIVGEIIYNCRSCLDNAWFVVSGSRRRQGFPFYANEFKARFRGKQKGAIKTAVEILRYIDPYQTDSPLGCLADLDNLNKHEALILCASRLREFKVPTPDGSPHNVVCLGPLEEDTILTVPVGPIGDVNMEYQLPFEVTFAETKITKSEAVIPTLEQYTSAADGILTAFVEAKIL